MSLGLSSPSPKLAPGRALPGPGVSTFWLDHQGGLVGQAVSPANPLWTTASIPLSAPSRLKLGCPRCMP